MFSLIISIIAIALVAALALASIYYGGAAFQEGSTDAEASTVINQGQQIQGAVTLADVDEKWDALSTEATLVGDYLKEVPSVRANSWTIGAGETQAELILVESVDDNYDLVEVCTAINEEAGLGNGTITQADITGQFGCITASSTAVYKL